MERRLGWGVERLILATLVVLGILNFLNLLSVFGGYVLDVIAWTTIAYVIYAVSPTELFFGERHAGCDVTIVLSYVILSAKDLVANAVGNLPSLVNVAPSFIKFVPLNVTNAIPFAVGADDMNAFRLFHAVPSHIVQAVVTNFNMAQQQINITLVSGAEQVGLVAYPTSLNGSLLMFYNSIVAHAAVIEQVSLVLGMVLLLGVAIFASYRIPVHKPSILSVVHEDGRANLKHAFAVFLFLVGFFVIVFNLLFEWMTITNDTPLLLITIAVVFVFIFVQHRHLRYDEIIEDLGTNGYTFYNKVIRLFMDSKTILLGVSGFLVLHLVTDVGNFIAPAFFFWFKTIYVNIAAGDHTPLLGMMQSSWTPDVVQNILIVTAYVVSTLGLVLLLTLPAVIWYKLFKIRESHEHLPDWKGWHVGVVLGAIAVYILIPVFKFTSITGGELVGVNLISSAITPERMPAMQHALIIGVIVLVLCAIIGAVHDYARRLLMIGPFLGAIIFLGIYVYYYFTSAFVYYATILVQLLQHGTYAVVPSLFILFAFTILFFITGFLSFLYEIWRD